MHLSTKASRFNKVKNRNHHMSSFYSTSVDLLASQPLFHLRPTHINKKYVNDISEDSPVPYKRTSNLQIKTNLQHPNQYTGFKNSNRQNVEHNLSDTYLNNKCALTLNIKKSTATKNNLQNMQYKKSPHKFFLEAKSNTDHKKDKEISKLHQFDAYKKEYQLESLNEIFSNSTESLCPNVANKEIDGGSIDKCNVKVGFNSGGATTFNKMNIQRKTNENESVDHISDSHHEEASIVDYINKSTKGVREKTPMCLINDLARFNKIPFQYRLTSENGPAHCKRFTVTLKLGSEEYTAEGFKIKKAQHLAAKEAIENTNYKHPLPKTNRRNGNTLIKSNITPTVELNALAMKLGQQTYYVFDPKQIILSKGSKIKSDSFQNFKITDRPCETNDAVTPNLSNAVKNNLNQKRLNKFENRYSNFQQPVYTGAFDHMNALIPSYLAPSSACKITLIVGTQKFIGIGRTLQQAKHDAAANALQILKKQINSNQIKNHIESFDQKERKSPISLVFEIGIKRNLPVDFKVLREEGPAHMRTFTTACVVGNISTEGEGTGKKLSKKKAAQKMLEKLNELPPLSSVTPPLKRTKLKRASKKVGSIPTKSRNVVNSKDIPSSKHKSITTESDSSNPITKLLEWHQNNKVKEPVFKLISEYGKENSRSQQFVMEIISNKIVARGVGNSKKLAKRDAAQNFLNAVSGNNALRLTENVSKSFVLTECSLDGNESARENGASIVTSDDKTHVQNKEVLEQYVEKYSGNVKESSLDIVTADQISNSLNSKRTALKSSGLHMKDKLLYLAKLLGFEVDFSDYPKGNHNEFLTIVMLSTNPPQICHGVGTNALESQEDAAENALKILSEMGLNKAVKARSTN